MLKSFLKCRVYHCLKTDSNLKTNGFIFRLCKDLIDLRGFVFYTLSCSSLIPIHICLCVCGGSMTWTAIRSPVFRSRNRPRCQWSPWLPVWMTERWKRSWRSAKGCRRRFSGYERRTNRSGWGCVFVFCIFAHSRLVLSICVKTRVDRLRLTILNNPEACFN